MQPLIYSVNKSYESVMRVNQYLFTKQRYHYDDRENIILSAINDILKIQKPLFIYWNIEHIPFKKQVRWCEMLNREVRLLRGLLKVEESKNIDMKFIAIDWEKAKQLEFINNMMELHKYTHSKCIRANNTLNDFDTPILIDLINSALYEVIMLNQIYPVTYEEYMEREYKIDTALQCLDNMAVPITSLSHIMKYSLNTINKWIELIEDEIKLLKGLKKSDKGHFSNLPKISENN